MVVLRTDNIGCQMTSLLNVMSAHQNLPPSEGDIIAGCVARCSAVNVVHHIYLVSVA